MKDHYDVVIVGAGAAGLASAARLRSEPLEVALIEARGRVGGRSWTIEPRPGLPVDAGCEWLHSAISNVLAPLIEAKGFTIDRSPAHWQRRSDRLGFSAADARAFGAAFTALDERLEAAAATGLDAAAGDFLEPGGRWNGLLNAASSWYNGVEWDRVSVLDYAAYGDGATNWRVREGYGAGIAAAAGPLEPILSCPVERIDHGEKPVRVVTTSGTVTARAVILAVPTPAIERLRFNPTLPDKAEAAAGLPLGLADKAFLALGKPEALPEEGHCFGRTDGEATASYHLRPFGRPYIEAYFGGRLAHSLEENGVGTFHAFAVEQLTAIFGPEFGRTLSPLAETAWASDPWALGSYSHAQPGHAGDREHLAASVDDRLFFAGEATHPTYFSTAHGAWESGMRAAEEAIAVL